MLRVDGSTTLVPAVVHHWLSWPVCGKWEGNDWPVPFVGLVLVPACTILYSAPVGMQYRAKTVSIYICSTTTVTCCVVILFRSLMADHRRVFPTLNPSAFSYGFGHALSFAIFNESLCSLVMYSGLQLDWLVIADWTYARVLAVAVLFPLQRQFLIPRQKLHGAYVLVFF